MTIQPLSSRPREISVTEPIEPAYERVKLMLFRPFDLSKWIVIGFCAWLAGLGESGGGGGFGYHNGQRHTHRSGEDLRHVYDQAHDYVLANLTWLVPVVVFALLLSLALGLLILWLNSRGKFMFLHCVAGNVAEVEAPWQTFARQANSLFRFRLALSGVAIVLCLPLVVFLVITVAQMVLANEPTLAGIMTALGLVFALVLVSVPFALVHKFTKDFVVPILFLRGGTCLAGWKEFWGLLCRHPGQFTVYILFQIVLHMAIGALIVAAVLVTCCLAGCLMVLPFIGTVLLLPILIFKRSYSLYFLAQFGPEYEVFPRPAAPPAPPVAPISPLLPVP